MYWLYRLLNNTSKPLVAYNLKSKDLIRLHQIAVGYMKKSRDSDGLCDAITLAKYDKLVSIKEADRLLEIVRKDVKNKRTTTESSLYYFPPYDWEIRLQVIEKLLHESNRYPAN